jgi:hypothetical protein
MAEPPLSPPEPSEKTQEKTIYVRSDEGTCVAPEPGPSSCFVPVVDELNDLTHDPFGGIRGPLKGIRFQVADPTLEHVVFKSEAALTPEGKATGRDLYEWSSATRQLRLVNELPNGEIPAAEAGAGFTEGLTSDVRHAISADGSRVFWGAGKHLYVREPYAKAEGEEGRTLQIDVPQAGVTGGPSAGAVFQDATPDGSRVFFTDEQRLTANASPSGHDLYECHLTEEEVEGKHEETCALTDLSPPLPSAEPEPANVLQFVPAVSEEENEEVGVSVYFAANGVLSTAANAEHQNATPGACTAQAPPGLTCNLYVEHFNPKTSSWEAPVFVSLLSSEDTPDYEEANTNLQGVTGGASPNGQYFAFMSDLSLTGYNNRDLNPAANEARDEEVYLYDRATAKLTCVSCDPTGERPRGVLDHEESGEGLGLLIDRNLTWEEPSVQTINPGRGRWLSGSIPGWTTAEGLGPVFHQSRFLSDSGRLFFDSASPLVPEAYGDTRSEPLKPGETTTVGVTNVYEYEPEGVGSCAGEQGCVALMSSATSHKESALIEASANGDDVFFITAAALVPQDRDTAYDVYDARVCTVESPCISAPSGGERECESGEECQGKVAEVPAFTPPSATSDGIGNTRGASGVLPAKEETKPVTKPTSKQLLAKALAACKKDKKRKKRQACEAAARKKYGPKKKSKKRK